MRAERDRDSGVNDAGRLEVAQEAVALTLTFVRASKMGSLRTMMPVATKKCLSKTEERGLRVGLGGGGGE